MAFQVAHENRADVVDYLRERELVTNVYLERKLPVTLADGRQVTALSYVVDRSHQQYAGALEIEDAARIVHASIGQSGPNDAYVLNTVQLLQSMGIRDAWLEAVAEGVVALQRQAVA